MAKGQFPYFDSHLDQYGPQSGGWGSAEQLQDMGELCGALRVLFCEIDGGYPQTVDEHLRQADYIRSVLHPAHMPAGFPHRLHVEGLESASEFTGLVVLLNTLISWGVHGATPIYHRGNPLGGASRESGTGLHTFGKIMLDALWKEGWWVDVAHMSHASIREVLRLHQPGKKLCYTHGGIQHSGLSDPLIVQGNRERCLTLDLAKEILKQGGLVALSPALPFYPDRSQHLLGHLRELWEVAPNRVAIGTDYGGILDSWRWERCETVGRCFHELAAWLKLAGWADGEIENLLGWNAQHFFMQ